MLPDEDHINLTNVAVAALLYKEITRLATLDARSTNNTLRENLKISSKYYVQVKGDVDKVNSYFMQNISQLLSRGEGANGWEDILMQHITMFQMMNSRSTRTKNGMTLWQHE